jgi:hypothetical protein
MGELLETALEAHGGLQSWQQVHWIELESLVVARD